MKYLNFKLLFFLAALAIAIPPAWAGTTYQKVTNRNQMVVGKHYILVYNNYAFGPLNSSGHGSEVEVTVNADGTVDIEGSSPLVFTLTSTSSGNYNKFETSDGFFIPKSAKDGAFQFVSSDGNGWNLAAVGDNFGITSNVSENARGVIHRDGYNFRHYAKSNATSSGYGWALLYVEAEGSTPVVAKPTFSPEGDTYYAAQSVRISCATDGATIHYTTNGDTPDENSAIYSSPITVNETMTIKAIAVKDGMTNSDVAEATYTINNPGSLTQYRKITSTSELTIGENYLIVCEGQGVAFDGSLGLSSIDLASNCFAVDINDGVIYTDKEAYFTIAKYSNTKRSIKSASGLYIGNDYASNKIDASTSTEYANTISFDGGNAVIKGDGGYVLRYNKSSGQTRFRYYNGTQEPIALYKKVSDEPVGPVITVEPESVTITDATGDDKTGTISATVDPAGTVNATATDGWSATTSSVTYQGLALHAEGSATFSSEGATDVTADLEYNYAGPLYILGTVNNGGWAPNNYVAMTRGTDGLYTVRVTTNAGNEGMSWISFTKRVANDNDNNAWAYIAPYRFVPYSENVNTAWWLTDVTVNQFNALDFNTGHVDGQPVRMAPGTYDITINANDNTFKIEPYIVTVETPTFDPEGGSYKAFQSVTINCATQGATIHYTVDGSEPTESSPVYGEPIAVESTTTIKAIATMNGMANSAVAEATYTLPQTVATVAAANTVDANSYFLFTGDAVVTYAGQSTINSNYHYIFIRDKGAENGGGVIYYNTNNNANVPNVQATNVLKRGWYAQLRPYHNWKEFQYAENVEASGETAAAAPFDRTGMELKYDDNVNEYIKINNVTYSEGNISYAGQNREDVTYTYKVVNHFNVSLEDGKHYNIEGVVTRNNSTIEFYPTAATIAKQNPELAFNPDNVSVYEGVQDFPEPELTVPEGLTVTYTSTNADVVTVDENGNVTIVAPGNADITASVAESTYYTEGSATYHVVIKAKEAAGLSFGVTEPVTATYGDTEFNEPTLTYPAGLTVTYTCEPESVATVDPATGAVTIVGAGTATVTATTEGDESHNGGSATYTINVAKAVATLSFSVTEPVAATYGDTEFTEPELTKPEGLAVSYSCEPEGVVTVDPATGAVTIVGAGTATVTATAQGNANYNEGATASYTINVAKADATMSFSVTEPVAATYGDTEFTEPELTKPEGLAVSYSCEPEGVVTVDPATGAVTIVGAGTATVTATAQGNANYNEGATASYTINVAKADATMSFGVTEPLTATYGDTEFTEPELTKPEGLAVSYNCEPEGVVTVDPATGEVAIVGAGTATVTATAQGNANYNEGATASYTINVAKADATMNFTPSAVTIVEGQEFTAPTLTNEAGLTVTYESRNEAVATVDQNTGAVTINGVGETTITATGAENDNYKGTTATYTITVVAKPVVATPTFTPAAGYYNSAQNVTIACETAGADIYYTTDGTVPTTESMKYTEAIPVGENMTIKAIAIKEGYTTSEVAEAEYTIDLPVQIAGLTFMPGSGYYTEAKEVAIACATPDVTISYKIGNGEFQPYTKPFIVDQSCTVTAKATKGDRTVWTDSEASATYTISTLPAVQITDGYYQIKNNGNNQYANVQGRKTMTFTNAIDQQAGTVIRVQTDENGQVKVLRSQAADLQGYADRAMRYVPELVQMVANKLHAEGTGEILGQEGLDAIMQKFNESFDHHLYVEGNQDNYRIYGKTPSMQPVVDFYLENQAKVDAKLPMLEDFINDAIQKVLNKTQGHGASILVPFSLDTIWNRMGGALIRPVDEESTMAFYHQVLTNKQYVWEFAYQTATFYLEKVTSHPKYIENKDEFSEYTQYIDKLDQIRPDTKYFIIQKNGKVDYISEGNVDIINNEPWTFWNVESRSEFKVNFSDENAYGTSYVTTLYTDFAYDVPETVTAYKVTKIKESGNAVIEALKGTIPAQTPVLLISTEAGAQTLTLNIAPSAQADTTGNLLYGPDYLIKKYEIKTPQVEAVFNLAKEIFGDNFYNNNVAQYEHLMLKTAGTVNNRYFWGLTDEDLNSCITIDEEGTERLEVRSLDNGEQGIGFYNNWTVSNNKAFLVNTEFNPIKLYLKGDVTRDGLVNISDVAAQIDILLKLPNKPYLDVYDYEAADFEEDGILRIHDVTELINYLLTRKY